jgi:hypothetical protein
MNNCDLIDFMLKAKLSGYSANDERGKIEFDDGSVGFEFSQSRYRYIDRYYGFNPFSGTEHIFEINGPLIWKMNYYGVISTESCSPKIIYAFLREAMSLITREYPFRGPPGHEKDDLSYLNQHTGTVQSFNGMETIHLSGEKVYYLYYHGGSMK